MATLVNHPAPPEFEQLLQRRHALGQDALDEMWEGVYHMNPSPHPRHGQIAQQLAEVLGPAAREAGLVPLINIFNLGDSQDYRVPDGGLFRGVPDQVFLPTVALVVEIVSPDDETWAKLDFYAAHDVDELLIVDPQKREVHWLGLGSDRTFQPVERSALVSLGAAELANRLDWPQ